MTSQPAMPMIQSTLAELAPELFERFEAGSGLDRDRIIDDFFVEFAKREEMNLGNVEPGYFYALKTIVKNNVVPLYEAYAHQREEIQSRQNRRSLVWYVLGTIVGIETLEAVITRGKAFSPPLLFLSLAVEGLMGFSLYWFSHWKDNQRIARAKAGLLRSLQHLDQKLRVDQQYASFKEIMGSDDLLRAEALEILAQYTEPEIFWRDYAKARQMDPVTKPELERLGVPQFASFLKLHGDGVYNEQAREHRFNGLFLLAHRTFIEKDSEHYALRHLGFKATTAAGEQRVVPPSPPVRSSAAPVTEPKKMRPGGMQHA